jgi:hypothetical protein
VRAAAPTPGLTLAAAATILASVTTLTKASDPRVRAFQDAYNQSPGVTHLVPDGKYGGSTQGALQSVLTAMDSALQAPPNPFGAIAYVGHAPVFHGPVQGAVTDATASQNLANIAATSSSLLEIDT